MWNCWRCFIYLWIIEVSCQLPYSVDYMNDEPPFPIKRLRIKAGSSINLNCKKAKGDVEWQFRSCGLNYRGIDCGDNDEMEFDSGNSWKLLQDNDGKKTLKITNASLENTGIYRCISKYVVRKTFVLEIDAVTYEWPPPKVISVIPNENVIHVNNHLTINCSVSSKSPLKILWFKECWTTMCEIDFAIYKIEIGQDYNCLCLINDNSNNSTYNWENLYISKLHIFNARIWDGGTYVCSALSSNGKDYKNVTITVEELKIQNSKVGRKSYLILLFIPMVLILLYVTSYLCCTKQKKNHDDSKNLNHLLSPTHVIPRK